MFYAIFSRKVKGDHKTPLISLLVNAIVTKESKQIEVICFPGYMSVQQGKMSDFFKGTNLNACSYFFKGMNGKKTMVNSKLKVQDEYNKLGGLPLARTSKDDHSKMMFFFKKGQRQNNNPFALLIGSSNQSYESYIKNPARKGEADIFIFQSSYFSGDDCSDADRNFLNFVNHCTITTENDTEKNLCLLDEYRDEIQLFRSFDEIDTINLGKIFQEMLGGAKKSNKQGPTL